MKGILLAGGIGSRLLPLTASFSKHLIPIYNKPLIYYPLSTLMLAGIKEILIVCTPRDLKMYRDLFGSGSDFGISLTYQEQVKPNGIAEGIKLSRKFLNGDEFCLILGDNVFHGPGLGRDLMKHRGVSGGIVFGYQVKNPQDYGVAKFDAGNVMVDIIEKPRIAPSNIAITGLYFYENKVVNLVDSLKPSDRNELEITDLNRVLLQAGELELNMLPRGSSWLDTGTFDGLHDASTYVRIIEDRTGISIGDPKDVARNQGWI